MEGVGIKRYRLVGFRINDRESMGLYDHSYRPLVQPLSVSRFGASVDGSAVVMPVTLSSDANLRLTHFVIPIAFGSG